MAQEDKKDKKQEIKEKETSPKEKVLEADSKDSKEKKSTTERKEFAGAKSEDDTKSQVKTKKKKKKIKRQISKGKAHIKCTYNNTIVSITDLSGALLAASSSGKVGFKGAKKATPYAAAQVISDVIEKISKFGVSELEVYVKGVGSGREGAIRALANKGFDIALINDLTPIPHNGCRPKKPRRI